MDIYELEEHEMNKGLAYVLGLIYPLYKTKRLEDKEYILGCVNHNSNMITLDEINIHFLAVRKLLNKYIKSTPILMKTNKCQQYTLSPKEGFSILIENKGESKEACLEKMTNRVSEIRNSTDEIKKEFVKGCFDGRASWDTTSHFLSIDVERNSELKHLIKEIIESLGIQVNLNERGEGHSKNDQIRIKSGSINKYMENINFYSAARANIVRRATTGNYRARTNNNQCSIDEFM